MTDHAHLLLPLLSSVLFVFGATFAKQATSLGLSPYTVTALSNLCLATCWAILGAIRQEWLGGWALLPAMAIASAFVVGQLCTYLAFRLGDVSLATPVFGVKIIMVAFISSLVADNPISATVWLAAVIATVGIAVIHAGPRSSADQGINTRRATLAIGLALIAAASLSLFDIGLQHYGRLYGPTQFLTTMFTIVGLLSLGLLPWTDHWRSVKARHAGWPLLLAALFMAVQAISISYALGRFGDATRVNIVYSMRGLWSVLLAWLISRSAISGEQALTRQTLVFRLAGAILLTVSVMVALA